MKKIVSIVLVAGIISAGGAWYWRVSQRDQAQIDRAKAFLLKKKAGWAQLERSLKDRVSAFNGTVGIVVEDLDSEWEISFNKDTLLPSASLVKVPIMLACFSAAQDGKMSLSDTISLKVSDKVAGSKALGNEKPGSVFTVEQLLSPMIAQSDNSAANILIDYVGFDTLNDYFRKMGLKDTNISRKMLDFEERSEGIENYTTAQDMAGIMENLYHGNFLNKDISERCLLILGRQKINDRIPRRLPKDGTFIAHKTGLERHICHDVGIVFTRKGNFLICVLVKHDDRYAQSAKKLIADIALLTYNFYQGL